MLEMVMEMMEMRKLMMKMMPKPPRIHVPSPLV
jgi:hypothetical protein